MNHPPFEQVIGTLLRKRITAYDADGALVESLLDTDALSAVVWAGDDRAALLTPVVEWVDAPAGVLRLTIPPAMTTSIDPGTYRLQVFVTPTYDGYKRLLLAGSVRFLPTAGSGQPAPVYGTAEDLFDYCPRIEQQLRDDEAAQAGFAEQRARARTWFDEEVLRNYHPVPGRCWRMVDAAGTGAGPYRVFADPPEGATIPTDAELKAILDADGLEVTDIIRECVSNKAAALAYATSKAGAYADDAGRHEGKAKQLWYRAVIEVKSDPELDAPDLRVGREITFLT